MGARRLVRYLGAHSSFLFKNYGRELGELIQQVELKGEVQLVRRGTDSVTEAERQEIARLITPVGLTFRLDKGPNGFFLVVRKGRKDGAEEIAP